MQNSIKVSVIMPTYNQGAFISRAIKSLLLQTITTWELIIINDGSTDYTEDVVNEYLSDERIRYYKNENNKGLGLTLNTGISLAKYDIITYLPSDDALYDNHLFSLLNVLQNNNDALIAYAGVEFGYNCTNAYNEGDASLAGPSGNLQLVQVMHRRITEKWVERDELVTDNLDLMYWDKLKKHGRAVPTNIISCEWVDHPDQRHKIISESLGGGIFRYKKYYGVNQPLKFKSKSGNYLDEISFYKDFRIVPESTPRKRLKILIVGELAFNPERIYALEQFGHELYALWIDHPEFYNTVGPLPFGNVKDFSLEEWEQQINQVKPDIIYALLNYQAISLAHFILTHNPGIPFVWHFKEGPFHARQYGLWRELMELFTNSDGQIFINEANQEWYSQFLNLETPQFILDGDLPKKDWFVSERGAKLSDNDGEIHTVLPGRPFGITINDIESLANQRIHLHLYGDFYTNMWQTWVAEAKNVAGKYLHIHPNCPPQNWAKELSLYDAGWLHIFDSTNYAELIKCKWNDLNYPARMSTLAAAGLPLIQKENVGHIVASERLIKRLGNGVLYQNIDQLGDLLTGDQFLAVKESAWQSRYLFSFDYHVENLSGFFYKVIEQKENNHIEEVRSS